MSVLPDTSVHHAEARALALLGRPRTAHPDLRAFATWYADSYGWKFAVPPQLDYVGLSAPAELATAAQAARDVTEWGPDEVAAAADRVQVLVDLAAGRPIYRGLARLLTQLRAVLALPSADETATADAFRVAPQGVAAAVRELTRDSGEAAWSLYRAAAVRLLADAGNTTDSPTDLGRCLRLLVRW